ncbi:DNA repair protein RadA, partial [Candidatus Parcubacteria bacterium]
VQALAEKSYFSNPIRRTSGFDSGRLQMLLAIINKRAGIKTAGYDIYINIVGGIKIKENAADLAICLAIISSITNKLPPKKSLIFGELGLDGGVRPAPFGEKRIKEGNRLGFKNIIAPGTVETLAEAVKLLE